MLGQYQSMARYETRVLPLDALYISGREDQRAVYIDEFHPRFHADMAVRAIEPAAPRTTLTHIQQV